MSFLQALAQHLQALKGYKIMATILQNSLNAPLPLAVNNGGTGVSTPTPASITYVTVGSDVNPMVAFTGYSNLSLASQPIAYTLPTNPNVGDWYMVFGQGVLLGFPTTPAYSITTSNGAIIYTPAGEEPYLYQWSTISPLVPGTPHNLDNSIANITLVCTDTEDGFPIFQVLFTNGLPFMGSNNL